jgi:hypothetical protein
MKGLDLNSDGRAGLVGIAHLRYGAQQKGFRTPTWAKADCGDG